MFLSWKEIKYTKGKFALIIAVVVLISYLVYFLTSLAYGLASSYTNGIYKWEANQIVLTIDSNDNIMMSMIYSNEFDAIDTSLDKAKLGLFPAVISNPLATDVLASRVEVFVFGIEGKSFIAPNEVPSEGLLDNQVIVHDSIRDLGYDIGDTILVSGTGLEWVIIGFTNRATYQTAPIVYTNLATWQKYRFGENNTPDLFSAIVIKGEVHSMPDHLATYTISDFVATLPGYTAQVLTFSIMIVFLIVIVAFVLGIFIYVITIQKTGMFGVMKAQGISNRYIGASVVSQTLTIVGIGIFIGFILTMTSGFFLAGIVPFGINILFYIVITAAFFLFSVLGGLFSVKAVLNIDPLKAIGG